jgi:hypothetical protein
MSTFALKIVAIITMFIDHATEVFIPQNSELYFIGRLIGRLAFPIFVFMLVEGFFNTSNIKKYLTRLGIFALISELPFDLAFYDARYGSVGGNIKTDLPNMFSDIQLFDTVFGRFIQYQNIFFTLFLGLLAIWLMSMIEKKFSKNMLYINILNALVTFAFSIIAALLRTDYNYIGVLIIVAFYLFRGSKLLLAISLFILSVGNIIQAFSVASIVPIAFYNGKKGKSMKYFFYAFYPVHLLLLYLLYIVI